jgi:hypothetical protein
LLWQSPRTSPRTIFQSNFIHIPYYKQIKMPYWPWTLGHANVQSLIVSLVQFFIDVQALSIFITWRFSPGRNHLNHEITYKKAMVIYVYPLLCSVCAGFSEAMPFKMRGNTFALVSKICHSPRRRYRR